MDNQLKVGDIVRLKDGSFPDEAKVVEIKDDCIVYEYDVTNPRGTRTIRNSLNSSCFALLVRPSDDASEKTPTHSFTPKDIPDDWGPENSKTCEDFRPQDIPDICNGDKVTTAKTGSPVMRVVTEYIDGTDDVKCEWKDPDLRGSTLERRISASDLIFANMLESDDEKAEFDEARKFFKELGGFQKLALYKALKVLLPAIEPLVGGWNGRNISDAYAVLQANLTEDKNELKDGEDSV